MRALGRAKRFLGEPPASRTAAMEAAWPTAGGDHVRLDELHGVVDGEAGGDGAARGIDVELNVFFGSSAWRNSIWAVARLATWSSMGVPIR